MKCGARVALGVAGGYLLGRTKKMKLALMLAGVAGGRRAGGPGELLRSGTKVLESTPELARLTDQVRGRLLDAGKTAALAVATRQVEQLTDRVGRRVESLGDAGLPRERSPEGEPAPRDESGEDEGSAAEDRDDGRGEAPDDEDAPPARRRPARAGAAKSPSATRTVRRTSGSAGKTATGRRTTRNPRTRRSEGDG